MSFLENCEIAEWAKSPARACRIIPTFGIHPNRADENAGLLNDPDTATRLAGYPKARPIIHWYVGPESIFREFIRRGYPQTFGIKTIRSQHIQKLLSLTPPELLLAETDNPDSEPWLGGTRSDVALIERVYNELAGLLKLPRPQLEKIIEENFHRILSN